ncbi:ABC transporter permease subunit [Paenibacillus qinlingensis]|uniref:Aldouronate transport system permease protein n=1 Tax=Paenibacillus qinlingensis TaxID=1837343 RepID=A0ABU1NTR0_9BACL|nr:ABC transporter permease subunit [Paenibacillus qinlingensis]MDR6550871.1 putative aldouronate transport system permease protein [Paenibacillus qinlingensis]
MSLRGRQAVIESKNRHAARPAARSKSKFAEFAQACIQNRALILMFIPGFALFMLFHYVPMYGIIIAFKNFQLLNGIWASPWAGLDHFRRLFAGDDFNQAFYNTLMIAVLKLVFIFPAPIILAILLNEVRQKKARRVIQTVSYLPHFFSWVILGGILFTVLGTDGIVNQTLQALGMNRVDWMLDANKFYVVVLGSAIWQGVGWGSIIYFAALSSIDPTLYEAAVVDGANRYRQIWHITLPSIMPTVIIMLLLYIGHFLSVGFDQIYNLTTPTNSARADILDTYVLRRLLSMDYELGAAAGIFTSVIGLFLVVAGNWLVKLYDREQGLW